MSSDSKARSAALRSAREVIDNRLSQLELADGEAGWNRQVKSVVVLLCASRSGSSMIYRGLTSNSQIIAPAGEHEPWLFLTGNKYPFAQSDALTSINNKELLLRLLRNDLLVRVPAVDHQEYAELLRNRLLIRGSSSALKKLDGIQLPEFVDAHYAESLADALGFDPVIDVPYWPVENPPFIAQPVARRAKLSELSTMTILFKSPSDAYRDGLYEELFPNARIRYVHITRGFAQTVNGLMDGWLSERHGFVSNPVGAFGHPLDIKGYSSSDVSKTLWCFDLYPGWERQRTASLLEICSMQWLSAHRQILNDFGNVPRLPFELLHRNRSEFISALQEATEIDARGFDTSVPVMSTEQPRKYRWHKRREIFTHLDKHLAPDLASELTALQLQLGYSMKEDTWL